MRLSLIVAIDRNRLIGCDNRLPWHLPADLAFFKRTTMGAPMLMGRRTWESIGRPLPGRTSIVVTRNPEYRAEGAIVVPSIEAGLQAAGDAPELFVIGGAQVFEDALPLADRLYLTRIDHAFEGDTWFAEIGDEWRETGREDHAPDDRNRFHYAFITLERARERESRNPSVPAR